MSFGAQNRYSLWLLPSEEVRRELGLTIRTLSQLYRASVFPAHCTLLGHITDKERTKVIKWLDKLNQPRIPFAVTGIAYSDFIWKTLYLQLRQDGSLNDLFDNLQEYLKGAVSYAFNPHISLLYKRLPLKSLEQLSNRIAVPAEGMFYSIALFSTGDMIKSWRMIHEKKLGRI